MWSEVKKQMDQTEQVRHIKLIALLFLYISTNYACYKPALPIILCWIYFLQKNSSDNHKSSKEGRNTCFSRDKF